MQVKVMESRGRVMDSDSYVRVGTLSLFQARRHNLFRIMTSLHLYHNRLRTCLLCSPFITILMIVTSQCCEFFVLT